MLAPPHAFEIRASYYGTKGLLAFDGQRLTFTYTTGFFSKSQRIPINIPASLITSVGVEGAISKKLVVRTSQTEVIPRYEFQVSEPHRWASWLSSAIHFAVQEEVKVVREVKEVVREVRVLVKCSHCGYHAEQGTLNCPTCGAAL